MRDPQSPKVVELDVRPYLRNKLEPFEVIMNTVKTLNKEDIFVLHATFKPTPLLGMMKLKGYVNKVEKLDDDHWRVTFVHKSRAHELEGLQISKESENKNRHQNNQPDAGEKQVYYLDNRGLEPPEPMKRTLGKLSAMNPGDVLIIHNDRVPVFLIEELEGLGYPYEVEEQPDGSARVKIEKIQGEA